jgi:hypothetical protein
MVKLPPNEKLEQLRREGKTISTQNKLGVKQLAAPKRAKPYLTGEKFKGKVRPGQAAPAGKTSSGRKWEKL